MKLGLALMLALARAAAAADAKPPAPPECAPHDDPKLCGQVVKILFDLDALWSKPYEIPKALPPIQENWTPIKAARGASGSKNSKGLEELLDDCQKELDKFPSAEQYRFLADKARTNQCWFQGVLQDGKLRWDASLGETESGGSSGAFFEIPPPGEKAELAQPDELRDLYALIPNPAPADEKKPGACAAVSPGDRQTALPEKTAGDLVRKAGADARALALDKNDGSGPPSAQRTNAVDPKVAGIGGKGVPAAPAGGAASGRGGTSGAPSLTEEIQTGAEAGIKAMPLLGVFYDDLEFPAQRAAQVGAVADRALAALDDAGASGGPAAVGLAASLRAASAITDGAKRLAAVKAALGAADDFLVDRYGGLMRSRIEASAARALAEKCAAQNGERKSRCLRDGREKALADAEKKFFAEFTGPLAQYLKQRGDYQVFLKAAYGEGRLAKGERLERWELETELPRGTSVAVDDDDATYQGGAVELNEEGGGKTRKLEIGSTGKFQGMSFTAEGGTRFEGTRAGLGGLEKLTVVRGRDGALGSRKLETLTTGKDGQPMLARSVSETFDGDGNRVQVETVRGEEKGKPAKREVIDYQTPTAKDPGTLRVKDRTITWGAGKNATRQIDAKGATISIDRGGKDVDMVNNVVRPGDPKRDWKSKKGSIDEHGSFLMTEEVMADGRRLSGETGKDGVFQVREIDVPSKSSSSKEVTVLKGRQDQCGLFIVSTQEDPNGRYKLALKDAAQRAKMPCAQAGKEEPKYDVVEFIPKEGKGGFRKHGQYVVENLEVAKGKEVGLGLDIPADGMKALASLPVGTERKKVALQMASEILSNPVGGQYRPDMTGAMADWIYDLPGDPNVHRGKTTSDDDARDGIESLVIKVEPNGTFEKIYKWKDLPNRYGHTIEVAQFGRSSLGDLASGEKSALIMSIPLRYDKQDKLQEVPDQACIHNGQPWKEYGRDGKLAQWDCPIDMDNESSTKLTVTTTLEIDTKERKDGAWGPVVAQKILAVKTETAGSSKWGIFTEALGDTPVIKQIGQAGGYVGSSFYNSVKGVVTSDCASNKESFRKMSEAAGEPFDEVGCEVPYWSGRCRNPAMETAGYGCAHAVKQLGPDSLAYLDNIVHNWRRQQLRQQLIVPERFPDPKQYQAVVDKYVNAPITAEQRQQALRYAYSAENVLDEAAGSNSTAAKVVGSAIGGMDIAGETLAGFMVPMAGTEILGGFGKAANMGKIIPSLARVTNAYVSYGMLGSYVVGGVGNVVAFGQAVDKGDLKESVKSGTHAVMDAGFAVHMGYTAMKTRAVQAETAADPLGGRSEPGEGPRTTDGPKVIVDPALLDEAAMAEARGPKVVVDPALLAEAAAKDSRSRPPAPEPKAVVEGPQGEKFKTVGSYDDPVGGGRIRVAEGPAGNTTREGDLAEIARRNPGLAEKLGIKVDAQGRVHYPDVHGLNARLAKMNPPPRFKFVPYDGGVASPRFYLEHWARGEMIISADGADHFHDMAYHTMSALAAPDAVVLHSQAEAARLVSIAADAELQAEYDRRGQGDAWKKAVEQKLANMANDVDYGTGSLLDEPTDAGRVKSTLRGFASSENTDFTHASDIDPGPVGKKYGHAADEPDLDAAVADVQKRTRARSAPDWGGDTQTGVDAAPAAPDADGTNPGTRSARSKPAPRVPADADPSTRNETASVPENVDPALKEKWERQNRLEGDYETFSGEKFGGIDAADWIENADVKPGGKVQVRTSLKHPLESWKIGRALERMGFEVDHSAESPEDFVATRQRGRTLAQAASIRVAGEPPLSGSDFMTGDADGRSQKVVLRDSRVRPEAVAEIRKALEAGGIEVEISKTDFIEDAAHPSEPSVVEGAQGGDEAAGGDKTVSGKKLPAESPSPANAGAGAAGAPLDRVKDFFRALGFGEKLETIKLDFRRATGDDYRTYEAALKEFGIESRKGIKGVVDVPVPVSKRAAFLERLAKTDISAKELDPLRAKADLEAPITGDEVDGMFDQNASLSREKHESVKVGVDVTHMPGTDLDAVREAAEAVGGKIEIKRYPMVEIVLPRGKAAEFSKALEGSGAKVLDAEEYRSRLESENVGAPAGTPASGVKKLKQLWDHNGGSAYMNPESVAAGRSAAFKAAQNSRLRGSLIHAEAAGEIAPASWQGLQGQESNCMPHALANSSHGEFSLKETVDAGVQAGIDYSKEGTSEENLDKMLVSLKAVSAQRGKSVSYRTIPIEDYFRQQAAAAESGEPRQAGVLVIRTGRTATDVHGLHAVALRGQIVVDGQHYIVITDSHLNTPLLYTPEAFAEAAVSDGILVIDVEQAKP